MRRNDRFIAVPFGLIDFFFATPCFPTNADAVHFRDAYTQASSLRYPKQTILYNVQGHYMIYVQQMYRSSKRTSVMTGVTSSPLKFFQTLHKQESITYRQTTLHVPNARYCFAAGRNHNEDGQKENESKAKAFLQHGDHFEALFFCVKFLSELTAPGLLFHATALKLQEKKTDMVLLLVHERHSLFYHLIFQSSIRTVQQNEFRPIFATSPTNGTYFIPIFVSLHSPCKLLRYRTASPPKTRHNLCCTHYQLDYSIWKSL